jgi:acetyltransferase EpsM
MTASPSSSHPIAIIGAGEHARVVQDICDAAGLSVAGFIAPGYTVGHMISGSPVLGDDHLLTDAAFLRDHNLLPGLGSQAARLRTGLAALAAGARFGCVFHPSSAVSSRAFVAEGCVLCPGAIVNNGAQLGRFCIVNTGASVDHDCILECAVQLGPGAILCGTVQCGQEVFIGAGAVILPGITLGAGAIIGAGAVVTRDVAPSTTVVGNPARQKPKMPTLSSS